LTFPKNRDIIIFG